MAVSITSGIAGSVHAVMASLSASVAGATETAHQAGGGDVAAHGDAALTVALALAVGIVAQSVARHLRLPGIVALLATGVLLGPDVLGVIDPASIGAGLHTIVEFAVAVILFEGGLNLDWRRLRREGATIRALISIGALVTALGGVLAARWLLGWDWSLAILFGTLVVVTGPTVITPLLRRIRVRRSVETVLEAEGVLIDAVGALLAVVALEIVLSPTGSSLALGFVNVPTRLVAGAAIGLVGGIIIAIVLRFRGLVPEGLENVFTLSLALALYQVSNALMPETGITSVVAAGLVVGNAKTPVHRELKEFKEQLTVMLIGLLFVLLAADVNLTSVTDLGAPAVGVVALLMFVVRPVSVWLCTIRSGMSWRERTFLSWLAPRGIVAAAVSSLFYDRLTAEGVAGGEGLRALVFLVIAITVVFQGMTGGVMARWLGVGRPRGAGYAILGAHELGRELGRRLGDAGEEVVLIDANAEVSREAQEKGFRVVYGNALEERVLLMAEMESRKGAIGALPNEAVNLLFARKAKEYKVPRSYAAIQKGHGAIATSVVHEAGARVLFGTETDLEMWSVRLRRGIAHTEVWRYGGASGDGTAGAERNPLITGRELQNTVLALSVTQPGGAVPASDGTRLDPGDDVCWVVFTERAGDAHDWLRERGWSEVGDGVSETDRAGEEGATDNEL